MSLLFNLFDPSPCSFPGPRVPLLPKLDIGSFGRGPGSQYPSGFIGRADHFHTRGRYALLEAFKLAGVGPQGALLAPAYHCRTMIDPAIRLNGEVRLYPLKADLAPDLDALARLFELKGPPVKALLLTHYFGFPQAAESVVAFCAARGIALIEDCSHAFFGLSNGQAIGTIGDYAVTSPYKFFACEDGGMLVANRGAYCPGHTLRAAGLAAEFRGVVRSLLAARDRYRKRVQAKDIPRLEAQLRLLKANPLRLAIETEHAQNTFSSHYIPADEARSGLVVSRWIMQCSDFGSIIERRRTNYRAWLDGVAGLPNCRALFPYLPDACVPYMFPLYIELPQPHFYLLKHLGVPIWRWDEMAVSSCPVSSDYRLHLLHLPCHQNLHQDELAWMIAAVAAVMRSSADMVK